MAQKWPKIIKDNPKMTKNDPNYPKWANNGRKWPKMIQNEPKWTKNGPK